MKRQRAEMRAELVKKAELLIDELLDWNDETPTPDLTQIEDIVLKLRKQMGEQLALTVIDAQEAQKPTLGALCPQCQQRMHYKAVKADTLDSRVGSLPLARGYYYCETCQTGLFPPR